LIQDIILGRGKRGADSLNLRNFRNLGCVGPWLWKEVKNKEEEVKTKLHRRHNDFHWVEVRKREEKMERST
jgi:hypothetical protein